MSRSDDTPIPLRDAVEAVLAELLSGDSGWIPSKLERALRAAHEAHDYDRLDWSLMQAKVAETAMATMRAEKAEAERDEARAEVERLRKDWLAVAQAVGVVYEADGHDPVAGPAKEVIAQARKNRDQALIAEEWELCEERDELRAEVERLRRERDEARREGAREALDRVRNRCVSLWEIEVEAKKRHPTGSHVRDVHQAQASVWSHACTELDRILADYAEPDEQPGPEVWGSLKDLEGGREDAEGDDVLRRCAEMIEDVYGEEDGSSDALCDQALAELCRRALGGAK